MYYVFMDALCKKLPTSQWLSSSYCPIHNEPDILLWDNFGMKAKEARTIVICTITHFPASIVPSKKIVSLQENVIIAMVTDPYHWFWRQCG